MAKKAEVAHDARKAATGCFIPTDGEFVGENRVRVWVDDSEQLEADIETIARDAMEFFGYRSTNQTFRNEFARQFKIELRKFHASLPDVREEDSLRFVKWEVEYAISQSDTAAKQLAEKLSGDDAAHALEWSTRSVESIAKGAVARHIAKLIDRIGEDFEDGTPRDFAWLTECIIRASVNEAARISHGSNEMNFLIEFYKMKAWANFARNARTQLAIHRQADEQA